MPIDELKELGLKLKATRKEKGLTQQELSDISHVSTKQIANIERGKMNPSYLILKALAKVVPLSLDSLLAPEISPDDEGANKMKILYMNCPPEMIIEFITEPALDDAFGFNASFQPALFFM